MESGHALPEAAWRLHGTGGYTVRTVHPQAPASRARRAVSDSLPRDATEW